MSQIKRSQKENQENQENQENHQSNDDLNCDARTVTRSASVYDAVAGSNLDAQQALFFWR
jgi:hypothetical protein